MSNLKIFLARVLRSLRQPLYLLLAWLALFEIFRLILVGMTWQHHGDATNGLIFKSFLIGLRFDLSIAVRVVFLFAVWKIWRPVPHRREKLVFFILFAFLTFTMIFTLAAEVEFYKEFQMRLGPLALEYFSTNAEHNAIIFGMVWHGYPVVRWLLACLVMCGIFLWLTKRFFRADQLSPALSPRMAATFLWIVFTIIAVRGGLQQSVLRWGDAVFSQSSYANQMAENGVFMLNDALRHSRTERKDSAAWKKTVQLDQAIADTRELILLPGETLLAPDRYPLLRTSPASPSIPRRPKNVVLVIMESFSARFCGATGADFGATPNYDALAKEGILFDRAFSVGTHTAQGVFSTLTSIPNLPDYETLMKQSLGQQPFRSLPAIFSEAGYETLFLYNGLFSWDNKEGFFRNQGMKRLIGRPDYKNPTFVDPDWGVSDHDVFNRALEEFSALAKYKKPFLGIVLTLSNHAPFNLPKIDDLPTITIGGDQNTRLNGIHYADWAVGEFMSAARTNTWFDDTLFVFTGDHSFAVPPNLTQMGILHMHVPILFYGPKIFGDRREVRHTTVGQLDILPSIIGLSGIALPHQAFGRDLFSLPVDDVGHAYVKRTGEPLLGWIEGDKILSAEKGKPLALEKMDLGFPPSAAPYSGKEEMEKMTAHLNAFVTTGLFVVEQRRAAPPSPRASK
ncbi:MAG: sulfatase-like hydrolase/transferase [Verrucomicrobiota bacterium]